MARTRSSVAAKVSSGKSSKAQCSVARPTNAGTSSASSEKTSRGGGGNPVCPRETPKWQRPITTFFISNASDRRDADADGAGPSKRAPKRNVIHSSDEEPSETTSPIKNKELDESIILETLTGENSHKIDEYYETGNKKKGVGKKTKNKQKKKYTKNSNEMDVDVEDMSAKDKDVSEKEDDTSEESSRASEIDAPKDLENKDISTEDIQDASEEKENISNNKHKDSNGDENGNISERKRERDDVKEDGNVSKKVKLH